MKHGHGSGYGKTWSTLDGRPYSKIRWDRCGCQNAKPVDQSLCDRCAALAERGWRVIYAA